MPRKFSDAIEVAEQTAPGTPGTGLVRLYAKSDGLLYSLNDAGVETVLGGTSSGGGGDAVLFQTALIR